MKKSLIALAVICCGYSFSQEKVTEQKKELVETKTTVETKTSKRSKAPKTVEATVNRKTAVVRPEQLKAHKPRKIVEPIND